MTKLIDTKIVLREFDVGAHWEVDGTIVSVSKLYFGHNPKPYSGLLIRVSRGLEPILVAANERRSERAKLDPSAAKLLFVSARSEGESVYEIDRYPMWVNCCVAKVIDGNNSRQDVSVKDVLLLPICRIYLRTS